MSERAEHSRPRPSPQMARRLASFALSVLSAIAGKLPLIAAACLIAACSDSGGGGGATQRAIDGKIQKGPFILGSTVTIQELDNAFEPTGRQFSTETTNDFGEFEISPKLSEQFIDVITSGFFFNEVSSELSDTAITLRAVGKVASDTAVNVNLLTQLARTRVKYLVKTGETFENALVQAQSELLAIFHIPGDALDEDFTEMDISGSSGGDAILLAISVTLTAAASSEADLSSLLPSIGTDIEKDGTLDSDNSNEAIRIGAYNVDTAAIRANLEARYDDLGQPIEVGPFEDFLDSDWDGTINRDDQFPAFFRSLAPSPVVLEDNAPMYAGAKSGGAIYLAGFSIDSPNRLTAYDISKDKWSIKTEPDLEQVGAATSASGGKIYLVGGLNSGGITNLVQAYNPSTGDWTQRASISQARRDVCSIDVDGTLYAFGGNGDDAGILGDSESYNSDNNEWTPILPLPTPRARCLAVALDGRAYVIGGYTTSDDDLSIVEAYNTGSGEWEDVAEMPNPVTFVLPSAGVIDGKIYVFTSLDGTDGTLQTYDPSADEWETRNYGLPANAGFFSVFADDLVDLFGGGASRKSTMVFDPRADQH